MFDRVRGYSRLPGLLVLDGGNPGRILSQCEPHCLGAGGRGKLTPRAALSGLPARLSPRSVQLGWNLPLGPGSQASPLAEGAPRLGWMHHCREGIQLRTDWLPARMYPTGYLLTTRGGENRVHYGGSSCTKQSQGNRDGALGSYQGTGF